jgi:prolyl-tRNA synthetase
MIAVHGDDKGLRLPFKVAPYQVVIVPIFKAKTKDEVMKYCKEVKSKLQKKGFRVYLDGREATPGWKYNWWEMKGVPIRVNIGPKEVTEEKAVLFRRDTLEKEIIDTKDIVKQIKSLGTEIDDNLLAEAERHFDGLIVDADTVGLIDDALDKGKIARVPFCTTEMPGLPCADELKDQTGGEIRGTRIDIDDVPEGLCPICGKLAEEMVYIARSY